MFKHSQFAQRPRRPEIERWMVYLLLRRRSDTLLSGVMYDGGSHP